MSGTGGFAVSSRSHGGDRFYNPPAMRRQHQKMLQQQQQQDKAKQQQKQQHRVVPAVVNLGNRNDLDDSSVAALSRPPPSSVLAASPPVLPPEIATNLDRLMESVSLSVKAEVRPEVDARAGRSREADLPLSYCLGDLWESLREWSVYGVGVPLVLSQKCSTMQYYVPFLSGMQLYVDPAKSSSQPSETSRGSSSDRGVGRQSRSVNDEVRNQQNLLNVNSQRLNRLSLRDRPVMSASTDKAYSSDSLGELLFEFLEYEQPHLRKPLADKILLLESQFPLLKTFKSCDLLPSSWLCIAWYPIYRIPLGPTLKDLDACFLTFHLLSTKSKSIVQPSGRRIVGVADGPSKISLPAFALASYKLKKSILAPSGPHESEQESALLQAASDWLQKLRVNLPDYRFFRSHYSPWR